MVKVFTGTPGSGKSMRAAIEIEKQLAMKKKNVIANFPINTDVVSRKGKKQIGEFVYLRNDLLTVEFLIKYARKRHKVGREGQTVIVIDEAGIMFNSRDYGAFDRKAWINFFMTHRHYGYDVILIAQNDRLIDRQIRAFLEYNVVHRKVNNYKTIGLFLTLFRIHTFTSVTYWYGLKERCHGEFFRFKKKYAKLYDTMAMFEEHYFDDEHEAECAAAGDGGGDAGAGGTIGDGGAFRITAINRTRKMLHRIAHSYVEHNGDYILNAL